MNVIEGENKIRAFRILTLAKAIQLETIGLRRRGRSAYVIAKNEFGLKGNRVNVISQLEQLYKETIA